MDTLSRIVLSTEAAERWRRFAGSQEVQSVLRKEFSSPGEIPDELAKEEDDGSLTIYVPLPSGDEIAMTFEPHEWAWSGPRNH